jgi:beta-galactosidase
MAVDSSPAHNDATLMNSMGNEWTPMGYKQGALTFDPMKRNVAVVTNNPSINPTMGITIAAWVNSTDWLGNRRIMQKGDGDNQFRLLEENGVLVWHLTGITNGNITAVLPTNAAFHHLAGTYDGSFVRLYIDGKIVAEEIALGTINVTGGNLHIGLKTPVAPPGDGFFGVMDEVVLYDRGLNPTEVARLASGVQPL